MTGIFQTRLPYDIDAQPALPGIRPLGDDPWLLHDEAFCEQMAERDRLIHERRDEVVAMDPKARPAALELLDMVLAQICLDGANAVTRPDGVIVDIDRGDPMGTLGRLVQEDLCILEKRGDEHVLTAAVLCFPASWRLDEKFLRPLIGIHRIVEPYDDNLARRVQRLFDGIQVGRGLWRFNALSYADPSLFQPMSEFDKRPHGGAGEKPYLRSERQSLIRLPETRAVVFSIHTFVLEKDKMSVG